MKTLDGTKMPLPDGVAGICDHCGSVANWFREWTAEETVGCNCWCHMDIDDLNPEWAAARNKRKRRK